MLTPGRVACLSLGALAYPFGLLLGRILAGRGALYPPAPSEPVDPTDLETEDW